MMLYVWLALVIIMVVVEALTMGLTSIWFAFGALAALLAAVFGVAVEWQCICFLLVSIGMMAITRPLAIKYLKPTLKKTNVDAIPGKTGVVTEAVEPLEGTGQVKIDGQIWSAKAAENIESLAVGTMVVVDRVEGVKVVVRPA